MKNRKRLLILPMLFLPTLGCAGGAMPFLAGLGAGATGGLLVKDADVLAKKTVEQHGVGILQGIVEQDWALVATSVLGVAYGLRKRSQLNQKKQTEKEEHIRNEIPPHLAKAMNGGLTPSSSVRDVSG